MNQPGSKENKNKEKSNQKKVKERQSITSAEFNKVKNIFEPKSNKPKVKKKFSINPFKFQRLRKVFEAPSDQSGKGKALPRINQAKMPVPMPIQKQPQVQQIQKKPEKLQKNNAPEIQPKKMEEPLDIVRARTPTLMPINMLSNLPYSQYSKAEYSQKPFYNISGYAFNSYSGTEKGYNEDRIKVILNYNKNAIVNNKKISPKISYFGIFDGHGGDACSNFLKDNLDSFIFNSNYFPASPIQAIKDAFIVAENSFMSQAIDKNSNVVDKSGSCACVILIINDTLYAINLGDSRALLSSNSGQTLSQITRDHKPEDPIEKNRIESAGANVYYANTAIIDGVPVVLKESDYGEGFIFPYRINPGGMCVSLFYNKYKYFR